MHRSLIACLVVLSLAACAGGGMGATPTPAAGTASRHRPASARLLIKVPPRHKPFRRHGHPSYISPATESLKYAIDGGAPVIVTTQPSNPDCVAIGSGYLQCTLTLMLAPGTHEFSFATYDGPDATGNLLSANTGVSCDVKAGIANQIAVTLGGVARSLAIFANSPSVSGSQANGYNVYGSTTVRFSAIAVDADGSFILGPGAPQPAVLATPASTTLGSPSSRAPNTWSLTSNAPSTNLLTPVESTLSVRATPVPNSGGPTVSAAVSLSLYQPWLYVINDGGPSISAFDEHGNPVAPTGNFTGGTLNAPEGMTYDPDAQRLYIADTNGPTGNVNSYDREGAAAPCAGCFNSPPLFVPIGIVYDPHNQWIYVVDYLRGIHAYDYLGNPETTTGLFADQSYPRGIAFDPANNQLYVANAFNNTVTSYDENGDSVILTGSFPNLDSPDGIAYDSHDGLLYVTNNGTGPPELGSITAYDENGNQRTLSGTFPNIDQPNGILYDPYDGLLYAVNDINGTVTAYDEEGHQVALATPISGLNNPLFGIALVP